MPLIECPDCHEQISDAAPSCPKCGRPVKLQLGPKQPINKALKLSIILAFSLVALFIIFAIAEERTKDVASATGQKKVELKRGDMVKIKEGSVGLKTEEQIARVAEVGRSGDDQGGKLLVRKLINNGDGVSIDKGTPAYIEDIVANGYIKIRIRGQSDSWYVFATVLQ